MDISGFFSNAIETISRVSESNMALKIAGGVLLLFLVLIGFKVAEIVVGKMIKGHFANQTTMLVKKAIRYTGFVVASMTLFSRLGIDLSALLGAAGIAGIAIGFAAQTSVSNIISGLFLISEKPFGIGDGVQIGDVSGLVQSIDLMSVKIQTYDNRFIRVPNETLIKSNVINVTRFPIRRFDLWVGVDYSSDLEKVKNILLEVARDNLFALDNPEPIIVFDKFDASSINIMLGVWFEKNDFINVKNTLFIDVKKRFDAEGIRIPFPQIDVHTVGLS